MQAHLLKGSMVETIYFGGGTPSLLSAHELETILNKVANNYTVSQTAEITLEANPDDLNAQYLKELIQIGFNRLSVGIQSFFDEDLKYMNRIHNSQESESCIHYIQESEFENFSIDLIFGGHTTKDDNWIENLKKAASLEIPHISIYGLTVEPKTALDHFIKQGKYPPLDDMKFERQFSHTQKFLTEMGYDQYEVSNYSKKGFYSKHNSAYWSEKPYLGIGPSSHSYLDSSRFYNISNNSKYIDAISKDQIPNEKEELTDTDQYNEYIMTRLRTKEGLRVGKVSTFPEFLVRYFNHAKEALVETQELIEHDGQCFIPDPQRIYTDRITQSLFYVA